MTIVASGSSLGVIVHPFSRLFNMIGPLGFGNTIRANAGQVLGFLLMSCLLMRTRLPPPTKVTSLLKALKKFSRDAAYIFAVAGFVAYTCFSTLFESSNAHTKFFSMDDNFLCWVVPAYFLCAAQLCSRGTRYYVFFLYSNALFLPHSWKVLTVILVQLVILNASSFLGRLTPGLLIHKLDVGNMITGDCGRCTVMILAMMGIKNLPEFIVFGVLFGFFAGTYITMNGPLIAMLTDDFSELGARMEVAFAFMDKSVLMGDDSEIEYDFPSGGPINGALLGDELTWWTRKASVISGILATVGCTFFGLMLIILPQRRAMLAGGSESRQKA
ncbi:hypothetical protein K435DRAFT_855605 [Dendrothele bispora CBS 962.96]|uniref:MFS general substrate transporter n=1 Tax=Dendrothele bispora (strain CBS 962.96) TaxID=1314807 RepID=A0A4S8MAN6_DENBC|nr:hypothetical protein K435DRAFT_855605 [Dendrothele bispora CBS 962.96]